MSFTAAQVDQLLRPVNPRRVAKDGKGNAHLPQQDVTAHLIRIFGFGNFDTEVREAECIFEHNRPTSDGKPSQRWDVGYRALVRLFIKDSEGNVVTFHDGGSCGVAQNQSLGDAHDLAYKAALSLSKKRAATNLGDQFGLSLYNGGQLAALVMSSLIRPAGGDGDDEPDDVQRDVPQQVAETHDGLSVDGPPAPESPLRNALKGAAS